MVRQWSFCSRCKGQGCKECDGKGTVFKLIPLESLKGTQGHPGVRGVYTKAQVDFIKGQEERNAKT